MAHFHDWIISHQVSVPVAVFVAGFLASPHCIMMCGPLAVQWAHNKKHLIYYQIGRASSYVALGTIAGSFGQALFSFERFHFVAIASLALFGFCLLYLGLQVLRRPSPDHQKFWLKLWSALRILPRQWLPFGSGVLTGFLPCGHLYGFFVGAAATESPQGGALFMFAFWLSTLPALALGPKYVRNWLSSKTLNVQRVAAVLFIAAGVYSLGSFAVQLIHPNHSHHH